MEENPLYADLYKRKIVRITVEQEECFSLADLEGDCFKPECNPDTPPDKLLREKMEFRRRVLQWGVFGVVSEILDPVSHEWEEIDALWGFVGDDYNSYLPDAQRLCVREYQKRYAMLF